MVLAGGVRSGYRRGLEALGHRLLQAATIFTITFITLVRHWQQQVMPSPATGMPRPAAVPLLAVTTASPVAGGAGSLLHFENAAGAAAPQICCCQSRRQQPSSGLLLEWPDHPR